MKKWENPQLFALGLEMTNNNDNSNNAFTHYCHRISIACLGSSKEHANINSSANKPHKFTGGEKDGYCLEHGPEAVACCCAPGIS